MDTQPVLIMVPGDNADTLYSVQPAVRAELDRLRAELAQAREREGQWHIKPNIAAGASIHSHDGQTWEQYATELAVLLHEAQKRAEAAERELAQARGELAEINDWMASHEPDAYWSGDGDNTAQAVIRWAGIVQADAAKWQKRCEQVAGDANNYRARADAAEAAARDHHVIGGCESCMANESDRIAAERELKKWREWHPDDETLAEIQQQARDRSGGYLSSLAAQVVYIGALEERLRSRVAAERERDAARAALAKSDPWTMTDPFTCIHCGHDYNYTNKLGVLGNHAPDCVWLTALLAGASVTVTGVADAPIPDDVRAEFDGLLPGAAEGSG